MPAAARATTSTSDRHWGPDDIGDLTGKVAVVTGANSGIGFEVALELAAHGAHVVLACRDTVKGDQAADRIVGHAPAASVEVLQLDLASQASVHAAAARLNGSHGRLDLLVNNAGIMAAPWALTDDGFERQFATNHLGPFAFTGLVLDHMLSATGSRVVTVSSHLHRMSRLDLSSVEAAQGLGGNHNRWLAYGNTKLANLLFTYQLDRLLRAAGAPTVAVAAHPGWARTNLATNGPVMGASAARVRAAKVSSRFGQSAAAGALPVLYAATASGVHGGEFFGPGGPAQQFGPPARVRSSRSSHRDTDAARLWEVSEQLTGIRYPLPATTGPGRHPVPGLTGVGNPDGGGPGPGPTGKGPR